MFYYLPEFIAEADDECYEISEDKMNVTVTNKTPYFQYSIFCNQWIDSVSNCIAEWKFEHKQKKPGVRYVSFGLVSSDKARVDENFSNSEQPPNYAVYEGGWRFYNANRIDTQHQRMFMDDIIVLFLNLRDKTFGYKQMDESLVLFDDIQVGDDIRYRLAMQIHVKGDTLTLLDSQIL